MTVVRFPSKKDPKPEVDGAWPIMTGLLVLTIGAVFVWQRELGSFEEARAIYSFGLLPAHLFGIRQPAPQIDVVTPLLTLVTAQFLHGGWTHLMGNVLVLLLLGPLLERRIGSIRFLLIFLATGVAGLGLEAASSPSSAIPIIGASASIAGVIGGLARVDPGARIVLPSPRRGQWLRVIRVPALPIIGFGLSFRFTALPSLPPMRRRPSRSWRMASGLSQVLFWRDGRNAGVRGRDPPDAVSWVRAVRGCPVRTWHYLA